MQQFADQFQEIAYGLGLMTGLARGLHTCALARLRHPWPLDPACHACRADLDRFVRRNHLDLAYRLFGWDAMIEHMELDAERRISEAEAYRQVGAGI